MKEVDFIAFLNTGSWFLRHFCISSFLDKHLFWKKILHNCIYAMFQKFKHIQAVISIVGLNRRHWLDFEVIDLVVGRSWIMVLQIVPCSVHDFTWAQLKVSQKQTSKIQVKINTCKTFAWLINTELTFSKCLYSVILWKTKYTITILL